jgi:predicted DNA-binding protein with PD1-like motif
MSNTAPFIVVLPKGARVIESLLGELERSGVTAAFVSGIGAVEQAEICYYELSAKTYSCISLVEPHEVLSLTGNVTLRENKPYIHVHGVFSDAHCHVRGGHLVEAVVAVTLEVCITPIPGTYERAHDETIGLHLLSSTV